MASALERKGYLTRETNKQNRRKVTLMLTERGRETLNYLEGCLKKLLWNILEELGTEDSKELIRILNKFTDITDTLKLEND